MPQPVGFEPTISTGERPKTYALDRAATGSSTEHTYFADIVCILALDIQYRLSFPVDRHDVQRYTRQIHLAIKINKYIFFYTEAL